MSWQVIHNDCLDVMATLDAESVDAIVTDPPYGLSFMGKNWDHGIPGVAFWEAAMRVAKPGCHLLAFGGTRTFHRLACAIEDAGWEIRDTIGWLYSTGFPKSHNFGCKCSRVQSDHADRSLRNVRDCDSPISVSSEEKRIGVLQCFVQEQDLRGQVQGDRASRASRLDKNERGQRIGEDVGAGEPVLEGRRHVQASKGELQTGAVRQVPCQVLGDGSQGRVRDGASSRDGCNGRATADEDGSGPPSQSRPAGQQAGELGVVSEQWGTQAGGVAPDSRCSVCGGLKRWHGWGTALKPAWEPVIVARKPLVGTVAENVLAHGCGAINVDGCRVNPGDVVPGGGSGRLGNFGGKSQSDAPTTDRRQDSHALGRWPANIIHDGSDEVVGVFPKTAGAGGRASGPTKVGRHKSGSMAGAMNGTDDPAPFYGDSGSAARFFYCAKASKADRDEGCEGLEAREAWRHNQAGRDPRNPSNVMGAGAKSRIARGESAVIPSRNHHPTVKPTALMRYLCRLVTPPGGVVLDPFCGSGSTGKAAALEGFNFIGIEREAEYVEIARARIEAASKEAALFTETA